MWSHARYHRISVEGEHRAASAMAQSRLSFLSVCFVVAYLIMFARLIDLSIVQGTIPHMQMSQIETEKQVPIIMPRRGDIYDANGFLLATTLKTPSLFVDPKLVMNAEKLAVDLRRIIPELDKEVALAKLTANNRFGWLAYALTPEQQEKILELGQPALGFQDQYTRIYPQGSLFAHIIGYTERDGLGLSGIERSYDDVLSKGEDVHLTIDLRLQHVVKREVARAMTDFNGIAGTGVILDVNTGEVLAGVSLPDFDLNKVGEVKDNQEFNRLTLGVYELGSMFKIFSTAAMLELKNPSLGTEYDARNPLKVGWHKIRDYHAQKRMLNIPEIFVHSSNIGTALMAQEIGGQALQAFYKDLGLIDKMRTDLKEVGAPLSPEKWSEGTTMTASFGHGLATTPLQMAAGVAMVVNGGFEVTPHFAKREKKALQVQVISSETSEKMRKLLRLVVASGTGKNAEVYGMEVGGKTGTAEKSINGKYERGKLISSFVGAFPMRDPRYVVMVMVDEPKGNKKSYGYATAGWVAAPAVKKIVAAMASIKGLTAEGYSADKDISRDVMHYMRDKKSRKLLASYE